MSFAYNILSFNKNDATMTVAFDGYTPYNYNAPRIAGVYLDGDKLETYIQNLHPTMPLTEDLILSQLFTDDPSTITGGEEIQAKYQAYIDSVVNGTPSA